MVNVTFTPTKVEYDSNAFFQYDYGQYLEIYGLSLPAEVQVHFARKDNPAEIVIGTTVNDVTTVRVPATTLLKDGDFTVYIFLATETSGQTFKAISFKTRKREKPADYAPPDEPNVIHELMDKLDQIIETGIAEYTPNEEVVNDIVDDYVKANLITNSFGATVPGTALDAVKGKELYTELGFKMYNVENVINLKYCYSVGAEANDTLAFQNAFNILLNGGTLIIPAKVYLITECLYVPSNVKIIGIGKVVLLRNSDTNSVMCTKSDGTIGGYDACKNITIENITFDGAQSEFQPNTTLFASGHASNITVRGCTFQNLDGYHMIEMNATKDSLITGCTFDNYGYGDIENTISEMLQFDYAGGSGQFPWYGPYDNTHCKNIVVEKNVFKNCRWNAIGNHSFLAGVMLNDIYIQNNSFEAIAHECISLHDIDGLYILKNNFKTSIYAIMLNNQANANKNIVIDGNKYKGTRLDAYVLAEGRFLGLNAVTRNGMTTRDVKIINNTIDDANTHAIGMTASDVIIANNTIRKSYSNAIYIYGGDRITISANILYDNYVGNAGGRGDLVVGNSVDVSSLVTITGNTIGKLVMGTNLSSVLVEANNITSITPGTAIVKNNVINGVFAA